MGDLLGLAFATLPTHVASFTANSTIAASTVATPAAAASTTAMLAAAKVASRATNTSFPPSTSTRCKQICYRIGLSAKTHDRVIDRC